ncbi:hypothetical protein [Amycolatopsis sp. FDAARGOS 1241]|uniref:hypothetical protein n=1 Tax=Amycolatopsis sp. FDAARGOS 1241 TaxID=2778070 RepID=UPI00194EC2FD|nr:hypothetical protein [Amycolatopsis sp. FDAARGOS 1241]QRP49380.1 hypothetical protein I6J71_17425 [Amycolatopsis sp. FDAARGOS 1241]
MLVTGPLGGVGRTALAVARRGGAEAVATVRYETQVGAVLAAGAHHVVVLGDGAAERLKAVVPGGVDRIAEIDLTGNVGLALEVLKIGGAIATCATGDPAHRCRTGSSPSGTSSSSASATTTSRGRPTTTPRATPPPPSPRATCGTRSPRASRWNRPPTRKTRRTCRRGRAGRG